MGPSVSCPEACQREILERASYAREHQLLRDTSFQSEIYQLGDQAQRADIGGQGSLSIDNARLSPWWTFSVRSVSALLSCVCAMLLLRNVSPNTATDTTRAVFRFFPMLRCFFSLMTNMYSLNNLGPITEQLFGPGRFLATYLVAGVSGNLFSAFNR